MSHINKITISNRQSSDIAHRNIFKRLYIIKYTCIILFSKQNVSGEHPRIHMRRPCFAMQEEDNGRVVPKDDTVEEEYKYNNIILLRHRTNAATVIAGTTLLSLVWVECWWETGRKNTTRLW